MEIVIQELVAGDEVNWNIIDASFTVDSTLVLSLRGRHIGFTVKEEVSSYTKSYTEGRSEEQSLEEADKDYSAYIDSPDQIVYLACIERQVVGYIVLKRNWNKFAYAELIAVDKKYRGYGIGRKLIEQAKRWARNGGMLGIMLETQTNNVGACQFYESCGFVIGGLDLHLYQGFPKHKEEIAIFWYLIFE